MSNFDFTDKAQQNIAAALQLAKDYANAQGMFRVFLSPRIYSIPHNTVYPVHLAFVILNEGAGEESTGKQSHTQHSLFSSVIQKAGGEPVCIGFNYRNNWILKLCFFIATRPQSSTKADRTVTHSRARSR